MANPIAGMVSFMENPRVKLFTRSGANDLDVPNSNWSSFSNVFLWKHCHLVGFLKWGSPMDGLTPRAPCRSCRTQLIGMRWIKPCARTLRNRRRLVSLGADFSIKTGGSFHGFLMRKNRHQWWLPMGIWYDIMVYIIEIYRDMIFIYLKFCLILFRFLLIYYIRMMGHTHNGMQLKKCIGSSPILVARINAHVFLSITGWWFGTFFIFPYIGKNNPNWLYFSEGLKPPTR